MVYLGTAEGILPSTGRTGVTCHVIIMLSMLEASLYPAATVASHKSQPPNLQRDFSKSLGEQVLRSEFDRIRTKNLGSGRSVLMEMDDNRHHEGSSKQRQREDVQITIREMLHAFAKVSIL